MDTATQETGAVEVTDVDSAAAALMQRYQSHNVEPQAEAEEVEAAEEETEEVEESDEPEEAQEDEADATEEDTGTFSNVIELAEAAGMDLEEFLSTIKMPTKVDGEEAEISLADLRKGYQLESSVTRKSMELAEQQKSFNEKQAQAQAAIQSQFEQTGYLLKQAQDELTQEFNAINWEQLQKEDPQDYLIQRQRFGERQARIDHTINEATRRAQMHMQQQQQQAQAQREQYLAQQDELLTKALPEWKKPEVRKAETQKVAEFLTENGFKPEEVANISDHRFIVLAHKAMNGKQVSKDVDLALKKVKKTPKLVKANARQNPSETAKRRTDKLKAKAFKSGRTEDLAAVLLSRRK